MSVAAILRRRNARRVPRDPATPYRLADLMAVDRDRVSPIEMADYARRRLWLSRWLESEQERLEAAGQMFGATAEERAWRERLREYEALDRLAPELTDGESAE